MAIAETVNQGWLQYIKDNSPSMESTVGALVTGGVGLAVGGLWGMGLALGYRYLVREPVSNRIHTKIDIFMKNNISESNQDKLSVRMGFKVLGIVSDGILISFVGSSGIFTGTIVACAGIAGGLVSADATKEVLKSKKKDETLWGRFIILGTGMAAGFFTANCAFKVVNIQAGFDDELQFRNQTTVKVEHSSDSNPLFSQRASVSSDNMPSNEPPVPSNMVCDANSCMRVNPNVVSAESTTNPTKKKEKEEKKD